MSDENGVWRTVVGRRIFIADGDDLRTAMAKSGKFNDGWDYRGEQAQIEKIEKAVDGVKTHKQAIALRVAIDAQDGIIEKLMADIENGNEDGNIKVLFSLRRRLRLAKKRLLSKQVF